MIRIACFTALFPYSQKAGLTARLATLICDTRAATFMQPFIIEEETNHYIEYYPDFQYDSAGKSIIAVNLLAHPNKDPRIEKITNQELFQSSSGASNTEMH